VKTNPENAIISLDDKQYSTTSRFLGTKFIQNLLPKDYTLEVAKAGFISWKKKIKIEEQQTNELRDILLIPQEPRDTLIVPQVETFFIQEEKNILIAFAREKESPDITFVRIDLRNPKSSDSFTFRGIIERALLNPVVIDDVVLEDKVIVHSVSSQKKRSYFLVDFSTMHISSIPIMAPGTVHKVLFHPSDPSFLIAHIGNTLWLVKTSDYSFTSLKEGVAFFTMRNAQGFLVEKDTNTIIGFAIENPAMPPYEKLKIATEHIFFQEVLPAAYHDETFDIFKNSSIVILLANSVYLWEPQGGVWKTMINDVTHIGRVDVEQYVAWNDNTVWLLSKEESTKEQMLSPKLAARYQNPIGNVYPFGMPLVSLIFTIDNRIEIRELSFDNQENVASFPLESKEVFFDQKTGMLYFIRDDNLYQQYLYP
jgi:hypothetical protein